METHRKCNTCFEQKDINCFEKVVRDEKIYYRRRCKVCYLPAKRAQKTRHKDKYYASHLIYRQANKHILKDKRYQKKYGISFAVFKDMFDAQEGRCAICKIQMVESSLQNNTAHLDHNHKNGKIRGILCAQCNRALGMLYDNLSSAKRLVSYLEHDGVN